MRLNSTSCFRIDNKSAENVTKQVQVTSAIDKLIAEWNLYYYKQVFVEEIAQVHAATAPQSAIFILRLRPIRFIDDFNNRTVITRETMYKVVQI
jgi:hypothetical protein